MAGRAHVPRRPLSSSSTLSYGSQVLWVALLELIGCLGTLFSFRSCPGPPGVPGDRMLLWGTHHSRQPPSHLFPSRGPSPLSLPPMANSADGIFWALHYRSDFAIRFKIFIPFFPATRQSGWSILISGWISPIICGILQG